MYDLQGISRLLCSFQHVLQLYQRCFLMRVIAEEHDAIKTWVGFWKETNIVICTHAEKCKSYGLKAVKTQV